MRGNPQAYFVDFSSNFSEIVVVCPRGNKAGAWLMEAHSIYLGVRIRRIFPSLRRKRKSASALLRPGNQLA